MQIQAHMNMMQLIINPINVKTRRIFLPRSDSFSHNRFSNLPMKLFLPVDNDVVLVVFSVVELPVLIKEISGNISRFLSSSGVLASTAPLIASTSLTGKFLLTLTVKSIIRPLPNSSSVVEDSIFISLISMELISLSLI